MAQRPPAQKSTVKSTSPTSPTSPSTKNVKLVVPEKQNHSSTTALEDMSATRAVNPNNQCLKVFVQRDYNEGTLVKFQTRFPAELEDRIDRQSFEYTVNQLNAIYAEAEKAGCSTYCKGCLACLTAYLIYICTETHYEKCLRKVAKFIVEQNERVYAPRGLLITDPTERGLRVILLEIFLRCADVISLCKS